MIRLEVGDRIVIVEDTITWARDFAQILKNVGEHRQVDIYDPDEFIERMQNSRSFENVSLCFVDLELRGGIKPNMAGDLSGLTKVLPHVRSVAPWVPIACISRFIEGAVIGELSSSDFDYFMPKSEIGDQARTHPEFNVQRWKQITRAMQIKRIASLTGRTVEELRRCIMKSQHLDIDDSVQKVINEMHIPIDKFKEGLATLGLEGSSLHVEGLQPGFSGLNVSRVISYGHVNDEPITAYWLIKWGGPISKLTDEAVAHRRLSRRGFERTLQIPQMYPNAISFDGIGFLVYAFEKDAQVALSDLSGKRNHETFSFALEKITNALYSNKREKPINALDEIIKWTGLEKSCIENIKSKIKECAHVVSWSLIHGDLHLRNVFLKNEVPTLIDFARSDFGPIAIDAAKMVADYIAFVATNELHIEDLRGFKDLQKSVIAPIANPFIKYLNADYDEKFFLAALRAYACKYLQYPDVPVKTKDLFQSLLRV